MFFISFLSISCARIKYSLTLSVIFDVAGNTNGLNDKLRGQIGVNTSADSDGWTIGPPVESEYAVEPVGVDTISPSD